LFVIRALVFMVAAIRLPTIFVNGIAGANGFAMSRLEAGSVA
jgi:hypothetical protein